MHYLHKHVPPIIHRDLKSPNLLVDKHWRVKVSGERRCWGAACSLFRQPWRQIRHGCLAGLWAGFALRLLPRRPRSNTPRHPPCCPTLAPHLPSIIHSWSQSRTHPTIPPDFNLSKLMEDNAVMSSVAATNPRWLSPEILDGKKASYQSDVYAFG